MNREEKEAIKTFFDAASKLSTLRIVRSSSYVGNIAEFVCADLYRITLSESQREMGLDGVDARGRKVEIKYHNGEKGTNIIMSKYLEMQCFDDLIVILGPLSKIRPGNLADNTFATFRINNYKYSTHGNIAKSLLSGIGHDYLLDVNLEIIKGDEHD